MSDIEISFDPCRIDFRRTSDLLMGSYWGGTRTDETNRRAFANSLCAGAYREGRQVGFGGDRRLPSRLFPTFFVQA